MERKTTSCRGCGYECYWMKTAAGKWVLVEADSLKDLEAQIFDKDQMTAHFANCPNAEDFRKKK